IQDGLRRMYAEQEDVYYYITTLNENYKHPALPEGAAEGIVKGMYLFREAEAGAKGPRVQLLGCGSILRGGIAARGLVARGEPRGCGPILPGVIAAADLLQQDWGVSADIWSCPSFTELRREAIGAERWNLLHPTEAPRRSWVETCPGGRPGPVVALAE